MKPPKEPTPSAIHPQSQGELPSEGPGSIAPKALHPRPIEIKILRVLAATEFGRSSVKRLKENQAGFCTGLFEMTYTFTAYQATNRRRHFAEFCKYTRLKLTFHKEGKNKDPGNIHMACFTHSYSILAQAYPAGIWGQRHRGTEADTVAETSTGVAEDWKLRSKTPMILEC